MIRFLRPVHYVIIVFILCTVGALIAFWPSDERRIRTLFREGIEAVESGNVDAVMSMVSFNYRDDYGLTYLTLREWLKAQFQPFTGIDVEEGSLAISVSDG